jgi:cardiolipin synthase
MHALLHLVFDADFGPIPGFYMLVIADILAWASAPSVLLKRSGRPVSALSWMLALFFLPYVGFIFWWLIGVERLERKQRARRTSTQEFEEALDAREIEAAEAARERFAPLLPGGLFRDYGPLKLGGPTGDNSVEVLVNGEAGFDGLRQMIERADHYVHLLFYIWQYDSTGVWMKDLLVEKVQEGVEVRVLVDPWGSPRFRKQLAPELEEAGAKVGYFLPPRYFAWQPTFNFRNHRKLVVCDGREAFTGGMNVGEEYESLWHDLGMRVQGPAVRDFHEVFLDDWYFATDEKLASEEYLEIPDEGSPRGERPDFDTDDASIAVLASGPDNERSVMHDAFYHAISSARERVWITTPYFVPGGDILKALEAAEQRDVDVRLLLPLDGDVPLVRYASRSYYTALLKRGVRIWEYQPRVLHGKALLIDDRYSFIGSANVDVRSFEINFEVGGFVVSPEVNERLAEMFLADIDESHEIDLEHMENIAKLAKFRDALAHLASPML